MKPIEVLLVEDNDADADLTRETLEPSSIQLKISVVRDGVEAIEFLRQRSEGARTARPDLILLDLSLPRKNGWEVLLEIKDDPRLRLIPVLVLTSSDAEADVVRSYDLGASCYVTKPRDLRAFQQTMKALEKFWFTIAQLPPAERGLQQSHR
jgi:chemotaxis family two-component system response regulator Rcp1